MLLSQKSKRNIVLFLSAFLLSGVLHVALYYVDFNHCVTTVSGSVLVVLWALTVKERVTDRRLCALMLGITAALLFHFVLQLIRYDLVKDDTAVLRYLWYLMYIPMTAQPVLCFLLALSIHRPEEKRLPRACLLVVAAGALLVLGVVTNDLHFQAWSFPSGILLDNGQERKGWLFYAVNAFIYGFYAATLAVIFTKNHRYTAKKYRRFAALPLLIGAVYFILYPLGIAKKVFPCHVWNMADMTAFCVLSTIEACIQLGMIPANRGYEKLFASVGYPAVIVDSAGRPVYRTEGAAVPFAEDDDTRVVSHPIHGGRIEYPVDIGTLRRLNREISERVEQFETRNAYLAEEARVMQESTEVQTRSRLYEQITGIVRPQLDRIDALLSRPEGLTGRQLARIAVLKAYIKRRSNMELLTSDGTLPAEELAAAVAETMEYVRLCGVDTASAASGTGSWPARMVTDAYEHIETVIEDNLDALSSMMVNVRAGEGRLTVRILLTAEPFSFESRSFRQNGTEFSADVSLSKEGPDISIVLTFEEGGGQA